MDEMSKLVKFLSEEIGVMKEKSESESEEFKINQ